MSSTIKMENSFFVYGSFRPEMKTGKWTTKFWKSTEYEPVFAKGHIKGAKLFEYAPGGYPSIKFTQDPKDTVTGYRITSDENSDKMKRDLDFAEGYPSLYDRMTVDVHLDSGSKAEAWVYAINTPYQKDLVDCKTNDWCEYKALKLK